MRNYKLKALFTLSILWTTASVQAYSVDEWIITGASERAQMRKSIPQYHLDKFWTLLTAEQQLALGETNKALNLINSGNPGPTIPGTKYSVNQWIIKGAQERAQLRANIPYSEQLTLWNAMTVEQRNAMSTINKSLENLQKPRPPHLASGTTKVSKLAPNCSSDPRVPTTQCQRLTVSCPDIEDIDVTLKISEPKAGVNIIGTVVLSTGGGGMGVYEKDFYPASVDNIIVPLLTPDSNNNAYRVIQRSWTYNPSSVCNTQLCTNWRGWFEGPGGSVKLACRYSTLIEKIHSDYSNKALCVTGNSGGASEISYALTHYGKDDIIDLALPTGGPPTGRVDYGCFGDNPTLYPTWSKAECDANASFAQGPYICGYDNLPLPPPENSYNGTAGFIAHTYDSYLTYIFDPNLGVNTYRFETNYRECANRNINLAKQWHADSVVSPFSNYDYPNTTVKLVFGDNDNMPSFGMVYANEIARVKNTPIENIVEVAVNTPHATPSTATGASIIYNTIKNKCILRH